MRKQFYLEFCDTPIDSGLGTISTCILSNVANTMDCRGLARDVTGIIIILHIFVLFFDDL